MSHPTQGDVQRNSPGAVLFASLIGTTVEFFDFYIYATAAVLVSRGPSSPRPTQLRPPCNR